MQQVLTRGTVVFHGTDSDDFDEVNDDLRGYSWLSDSLAVASNFACRSGGWGGVKRIVEYVLTEDVELPAISSRREFDLFAEEHSIDCNGVEEMRSSAQDSGIAGWVIPANYPEGADILLGNTSILAYRTTHNIGSP